MSIRSPICSVLGHVDHGKSSILDKIRGTIVAAKEAGGITQAIGASIIPIDVIKKVCGNLLASLNLTIPGLLFIDTPGHAAFTSLRKRGGSLADIAILVVDINEGFMPQTKEAIEILKNAKTPFIIAANKIDMVGGWAEKKQPILQAISQQSQDVQTRIDQKIYEIVGQVHENFQMTSERFDRVEDYTNQIAIVPCSAKTGEGIPELIMVITGLAQKYLEKCLECNVEGPAKGIILEVKEEKGLGKTMDVIIYDGTIKPGDTVVIGEMNEPIVAKVRALMEPAPLAEMREKKTKFKAVKNAVAATGVKISAPGTENAISGMPIMVATPDTLDDVKKEIMNDVEDVMIETEDQGIIIKADNLGSLEAMINLLQEKNIPIRKASIGEITKKDIADAESNYEKDPLMSLILAFNVEPSDEILLVSGKVKIIHNQVIYKLIEDYELWNKEKTKAVEAKELDNLVRPCKMTIMNGYVFRQNNPAIVGCEIMNGKAKSGMPIMNRDGKYLTDIKSMQLEKDTVSEAEKGKQLAVSLPNVSVGRQINEGDVLYSAIPEADFRKMKKLKKYLTPDEIEAIKEIAVIKRRDNPVWGV